MSIEGGTLSNPSYSQKLLSCTHRLVQGTHLANENYREDKGQETAMRSFLPQCVNCKGTFKLTLLLAVAIVLYKCDTWSCDSHL